MLVFRTGIVTVLSIDGAVCWWSMRCVTVVINCVIDICRHSVVCNIAMLCVCAVLYVSILCGFSILC